MIAVKWCLLYLGGTSDGGAEVNARKREVPERRGEISGQNASGFFLKFYMHICTFWCFLAEG